MLAPKLLFAAVFAAALTGLSMLLLSLTPGATSVARSHDPISWERATEKNRSTGTEPCAPPRSRRRRETHRAIARAPRDRTAGCPEAARAPRRSRVACP